METCMFFYHYYSTFGRELLFPQQKCRPGNRPREVAPALRVMMDESDVVYFCLPVNRSGPMMTGKGWWPVSHL